MALVNTFFISLVFKKITFFILSRYLQFTFSLEQKRIVAKRALTAVTSPSSAVLSHALEYLEILVYANKRSDIKQEFYEILFPSDQSAPSLVSFLSSEDLCYLILAFVFCFLKKEYPPPLQLDVNYKFPLIDWSTIRNFQSLKILEDAKQIFHTALATFKNRGLGKDLLPLCVNLVAMESALGNHNKAREQIQTFLRSNINIPEFWELYATVEEVSC